LIPTCSQIIHPSYGQNTLELIELGVWDKWPNKPLPTVVSKHKATKGIVKHPKVYAYVQTRGLIPQNTKRRVQTRIFTKNTIFFFLKSWLAFTAPHEAP